LALEGFTLPFGGKLNPGNRWVNLRLCFAGYKAIPENAMKL